ncbi:MAG: hypothetical protein NZ899_14820 [Thermoguttaceae bacterium]|nr:hypothetical protein [Thermoguttaceae bacterium]MDW8080201.1 hypothetical protein [Thermoguttaceae bacterium]
MTRTSPLCSLVLMLIFSVSILALNAGVKAQPRQRGIAIGVESLHVVDEDDPIDNDEPYLIVTRFEFRVRSGSGGALEIVPGSIRVQNLMAGHNNLGRAEDNWADEGRRGQTYPFKARYAQLQVPTGEVGWVVGIFVILMEEDGFGASTAATLSERLRVTIEAGLTSGKFERGDLAAVGEHVARKINRDLGRSLSAPNLAGIMRAIASIADPDDVGGARLIVAATLPGNQVVYYSGDPTTDPAILVGSARTLGTTPVAVRLDFPTGAVSGLPGNMRYQGSCRVNATIRTWESEPPY